MDLLAVITSYGSCPLNKDRSKLDSYELDLIISEQFVHFINRANSIQPIEKIFGAAQQNDWKKKMEPTIEVHKPWIEQTKESNILKG
eukprot:scaffold161728_cov66-Cyclotella_meneghiniana.AAC.2